jgi:hypothetical protein
MCGTGGSAPQVAGSTGELHLEIGFDSSTIVTVAHKDSPSPCRLFCMFINKFSAKHLVDFM